MTTSSQPESPVSSSNLTALSQEMWGQPQYGLVAKEIFGILGKRAAVCSVITTSAGEHHLVAPYYKTGFNVVVGDSGSSPEDIEQTTREILDTHCDVPFDYDFGTQGSTLYMRPQRVTKPRLRRYAENREFGTHALHGALGKAFDVLLTAAGASFEPADTREWEGPFLTYDKIKKAVRDDGMKPTRVRTIQCKALDISRAQIRTRNYPEGEELVLEAPTDFGKTRGDSFENKCTLAVSSLSVIAGRFHERNATREFLLRLQESVGKPIDI